MQTLEQIQQEEKQLLEAKVKYLEHEHETPSINCEGCREFYEVCYRLERPY